MAKSGEDCVVRANIKRAEMIAGRHAVMLQPHVFTGHVIRNVFDFADDNHFTRADRIAHMAHCPVLIVR